MKDDPAHLADELFSQALAQNFLPFQTGLLPPHLGRELFGVTRNNLRRLGVAGDEHAQDVLSMAMIDAHGFLRRHPDVEIQQPRGWLHKVCRSAASRYAESLRPNNGATLTPLLDGEIPLEDDSPFACDDSILQLVREAIDALRPHYRRYLILELVDGASPEEIREELAITSDGYFRKLKCVALQALKKELRRRGDLRLERQRPPRGTKAPRGSQRRRKAMPSEDSSEARLCARDLGEREETVMEGSG
jgi:DNA-directed RNA polymerase specialized sigma24 family protein